MPEPHAPSRSPESPVQERERLRALVVEQAADRATARAHPNPAERHGRCCAEIGAEMLPERRQVVEVVIQRAVTEYCIVGGSGVPDPIPTSALPGYRRAVPGTGQDCALAGHPPGRHHRGRYPPGGAGGGHPRRTPHRAGRPCRRDRRARER